MSKKLAPLIAAILPPIFLEGTAVIAHHLDLYRGRYFDARPYFLWLFLLGILCALLVTLFFAALPRLGGKATAVGAAVGFLLTALCTAHAVYGFGISLPWGFINPTAALPVGGLCLVSCILCFCRILRSI